MNRNAPCLSCHFNIELFYLLLWLGHHDWILERKNLTGEN